MLNCLRLISLRYFFCLIILLILSSLCVFFPENRLALLFIFAWLFTITVVLIFSYKKLFIEIVSAKNLLLQKTRNDYVQIESLLNLLLSLNVEYPFPHTRGWAASPDFLRLISYLIFTKKPAVILEASSGISTLIIAYSLKKLGRGKLLSLEHDEFYYQKTKELIHVHNLEKYCYLLHAPLVEYKINNETYKWYDIKKLPENLKIEMFVIDGPPGHIGKLARFPAIPLLYDKLSPGCIIILDDGSRKEEKEIVKIWKQLYDIKKVEYRPELEKGAYLIER